tara:strand:+ start:102 stop:938 length:837 start_codon:yes stop_codon:yes gene_type:complete
MFVPIGFMSPQGGGGGGFDVTLGGTLSVSLHWDFTDSSTMTLSGTDLTDITDKVGSETLVLRPTQYNGTPAPATFASDKTIFTGTGIYYKADNWIPDSMKSDVDFSVVHFALNDFDALAASRIVGPWGLIGTRVDGKGHNNLRPTQFTPGYDPYSQPSCLTGTYYFSAQRFQSGWTGTKQRFVQAVAQADKNMCTYIYNVTGAPQNLSVTLNNNTLCTISDTISTSYQGAGAGFNIGGRDVDYNGNWYGYMYHTIVYPFVLSQTNIDDLYASWVAFNA